MSQMRADRNKKKQETTWKKRAIENHEFKTTDRVESNRVVARGKKRLTNQFMNIFCTIHFEDTSRKLQVWQRSCSIQMQHVAGIETKHNHSISDKLHPHNHSSFFNQSFLGEWLLLRDRDDRLR